MSMTSKNSNLRNKPNYTPLCNHKVKKGGPIHYWLTSIVGISYYQSTESFLSENIKYQFLFQINLDFPLNEAGSSSNLVLD